VLPSCGRSLQQQRQRASGDQRNRPDKIEVEPRAAQDADAKLLEHQHRDERGHGQIGHGVHTGGHERAGARAGSQMPKAA